MSLKQPAIMLATFRRKKDVFGEPCRKNFDAAIRTEKSPAGGPDGKR